MKYLAPFLAAALLAGQAHAHVSAQGEHEVHVTPKRTWFQRWFHRHGDAPQWDGVHPDLRLTLEAIQEVMREEGFDLRLMEGFRSDARQAALLATGGGVTQVGAGRSCHNHGFAVDMVIHVRNRPSWDLTHSHVRDGYARLGELATSAGLRWGGAWTDFQDMPHVEMRDECLLAMRSLRRGETSPQWVDLPAPVEVWPGVHLAMSTISCVGVTCSANWGFPNAQAYLATGLPRPRNAWSGLANGTACSAGPRGGAVASLPGWLTPT